MPNGPATLTSPAPQRWWWIGVLATVALAALALHGPIAQPAGYHAFADRRAIGPLPNAADVLSNLPFALVGLRGFAALRRGDTSLPSRPAWRLLCAALVATAAGSAFYHWAPADAPLVADRIPIAWACVAVLAAFVAERGWPAAARPALLAAAVLAATLTVPLWWASGDLRAYLAVQGLPLLVVAAALLLRIAPAHRGAAPVAAWWGVLAAYAAAKAAEVFDTSIYTALGGLVSGHTLKHLLAAAGAAWLLALATSGSRR